MSVSVPRDSEIIQEASRVLLEHMSPAMVARFWAAVQIGEGDYLAMRGSMFAGETVESLAQKVLQYQEVDAATRGPQT